MSARPSLVQSRRIPAPSLVEKRFLLEAAFLYQARGRPADAIAILTGLLEVAEDRAALHFHLGELFLELNQPDQAVEHFDEAVHAAPAWDLAVARLAEALGQAGQAESADAAHLRSQVLRQNLAFDEHQAPVAGRA